MITVKATDRSITAVPNHPITSGSVGLPVSFIFSDAWDDLAKIAVFKGSGTAKDVALIHDECVVPAEVLVEYGDLLWIGVYGANGDGDIVMPTRWCKAGLIVEGTAPSESDPADPTPNWVAQVQAAAASALEKAEAVETAAAAGDFDGYSPEVTITEITGGHQVKITDADHTSGQTFNVMDGTDGEDGVSPTISVSDITGGHRITIVDANGTTTVDVMDGDDGNDGTTFTPSVDSNGDISWTNDGGKTNPTTVNIKGPTGATGPSGVLWISDFPPTESSGSYLLLKSSLKSVIGLEPKIGDAVIYIGEYVVYPPDMTPVWYAGGNGLYQITGVVQESPIKYSLSKIGQVIGPKGDAGTAATVSVGTVTTLPAGSNATVTNGGTSSAAVFNFGIPKGADGSGSNDIFVVEWNENSVSQSTEWDDILDAQQAGKHLLLHLTGGIMAPSHEYWLADYTYNEYDDNGYTHKQFRFNVLWADTGIPTEYVIDGVYFPNSTQADLIEFNWHQYTGVIPATALASGVIPTVPTAYTSNPAALGTASSPGSSAKWARGDHVHAMPSASDVGAIAAPSSPSVGDFLVYTSNGWAAQSLSTWSGGSY